MIARPQNTKNQSVISTEKANSKISDLYTLKNPASTQVQRYSGKGFIRLVKYVMYCVNSKIYVPKCSYFIKKLNFVIDEV